MKYFLGYINYLYPISPPRKLMLLNCEYSQCQRYRTTKPQRATKPRNLECTNIFIVSRLLLGPL